MLGQKQAQRPRLDEELEDESEGRGVSRVDGHGDVHQAVSSAVDADEDDALSYFQKLAEE